MRLPRLLLPAVVTLATCGCQHHRDARAVVTVTARFPVGSTPAWSQFNRLGEAPRCSATFAGVTTPLVAGRFVGRCGDHELTFEAVPVASVRVSLSGSHAELLPGPLATAVAPYALDHHHPEWTISLAAAPFDAAGAQLAVPASSPGAHWELAASCAAVVTMVTGRGPDGHAQPSDEIALDAIGAGSCTIDVTYGGAKGSTAVVAK